MRYVCFCLLLIFISHLSFADPIRLQSSVEQVSLLELYTSEGCSSCPPADVWVSALKQDNRLWQQVVPVAFHVDYWDYIGWPDRFAEPDYGQRQRRYSQTDALSRVYTPGLILAGQEWRSWFFRPQLELQTAPAVGQLALIVDESQRSCNAQFSPAPTAQLSGQLELHLVVLGFDMTTAVKAGENKGRELVHDFVVLGYQRGPLIVDKAGLYQVNTTLPKTKFASKQRAVAGWISRVGDPRPLQAVGGWL